MKKQINIEIGGRIRKQREALGMTREQLAAAADLSFPFMGDIELGRKGISPLSIQKLCDALHISADYLVRNRELNTDFPTIVELLSDLDPEYIPLAEELLRTYVKTVTLKKSTD